MLVSDNFRKIVWDIVVLDTIPFSHLILFGTSERRINSSPIYETTWTEYQIKSILHAIFAPTKKTYDCFDDEIIEK